MILYVVRHAIAQPHGIRGVAEDDRRLTPKGAEKMRKVADGLRIMGCRPDVIISSPLPRAKETARIVQQALGKKIPVELVNALSPQGKRADVYREFRARPAVQNLMIVGHQPSLGEIAGEIVWGTPEHAIDLKKGGACAIELETIDPVPRGQLMWLLPPSILRRLR